MVLKIRAATNGLNVFFFLNSFCSQGPVLRPGICTFMYNIWQDAWIWTRVAETAAVLLMSYIIIHTSHIHDGFFYTDKEEVEDGAEDCVEDDGPQVAHEHPVVKGVGRLC